MVLLRDKTHAPSGNKLEDREKNLTNCSSHSDLLKVPIGKVVQLQTKA